MTPVTNADGGEGDTGQPADYFDPAPEMPTNKQTSLKVESIHVLTDDFAVVTPKDGSDLSPNVPLSQLARFLNHHVDGPVETLLIGNDKDKRCEELLPRLLDNVRPERFHFEIIIMRDYFRHLPWPTIKRVYDSEQMMRTKCHYFANLQLPRGVDSRAFLMELGSLREADRLFIFPNHVARTPRFTNSALLEWLKKRERIELKLPKWYMTGGTDALVTALNRDFASSTQKQGYYVGIFCPGADMDGLVDRETLFNNVTGEKLEVFGALEPQLMMEFGRVSTVFVWRTGRDEPLAFA